MPSLTTLPPELLLKIFTYLLLHPSSLLQGALVCRSLLSYSRQVFFRTTRLVETTPTADRTREFAELLESNHDLGSCIHTLRLECDRRGLPTPCFHIIFHNLQINYDHELRRVDPTRYPDVVAALPFSRLAELRELVIGEHIMLSEPISQVVTVLKMLPRLERLSLRGVRAGTDGRAYLSSDVVDYPELPTPLALTGLELEYVLPFPICALTHRLLREFRGRLALRSLVVRCRKWDGLFEHHAAWKPIISAMAGSLRCLDISTGEFDHGRRPTDGPGCVQACTALHTDLLDELRGCKSLRTLRLDYLLASYIESSVDLHRADFLRSLCVLFENRPAFADHLEKLSLHMVDWCEIMVSVDRVCGDRLARALLDSSRYPRFQSLEVRVQVEDSLIFNEDEVPVLEKEEDRAIEARWREAFAGFGKAAGPGGFAFHLELERAE